MNAAERRLAQDFPALPWTEPLPAKLTDGSVGGLACRFCIALRGLDGSEIAGLPQDRAAFEAHLTEAHGWTRG